MPDRPWWTVLSVPQTATDDEIKTAYRKAALRAHPDRGGSTAAMQEINLAYQAAQNRHAAPPPVRRPRPPAPPRAPRARPPRPPRPPAAKPPPEVKPVGGLPDLETELFGGLGIRLGLRTDARGKLRLQVDLKEVGIGTGTRTKNPDEEEESEIERIARFFV